MLCLAPLRPDLLLCNHPHHEPTVWFFWPWEAALPSLPPLNCIQRLATIKLLPCCKMNKVF